MRNILFSIITILFTHIICLGQEKIPVKKIDVDSLLLQAIKESREEKSYDLALKNCDLGIHLSPEYLDFYLLKGRILEQTQKRDSARYYFKYVIEKNSKYDVAYTYLIQLEMQDKNYVEAHKLVDKAIEIYPDNKDFRYRKWSIYQEQKDKDVEYAYLKTLSAKYPEDGGITLRVYYLESMDKSERVGVSYSYTGFDRDNYGPWHIGNIQYLRQRKWGTLIGKISYTNRFANGESVLKGFQYEGETYFFTGKNSYSYVDIMFSQDPMFPKWRLGYSYFRNLKKGWECDLGFRYLISEEENFSMLVASVGKYVGSFWLNLRTYSQIYDSKFYSSLTYTTRYYFDTKFDYALFLLGYGTSPDETSTLVAYPERIALDSYRVGIGYYRLFQNRFVTGCQLTLNNQEYVPNLKQNELEIYINLEYKF